MNAVIEDLEIRVVGVARTPWLRREDAPHQPTASPETEGVIEVAAEYRDALEDVASFRRVWLVFVFDRSHGWRAKVRPPRGGPRRGVFATRAPNRPSQIGLTNVEVVAVDVDKGTLRVRGIDLLDGTPILDVKPYLAVTDVHPDAGNGWLQEFLDAGIEPRLKKPYRPMEG